MRLGDKQVDQILPNLVANEPKTYVPVLEVDILIFIHSLQPDLCSELVVGGTTISFPNPYHTHRPEEHSFGEQKMASHVVVIDSTARRAVIKVSPTKHLSDVLEDACSKLGATAIQYGLK